MNCDVEFRLDWDLDDYPFWLDGSYSYDGADVPIYENWDVTAWHGGVPFQGAPSACVPLLYTAHIRPPSIEYYEGASLMRVTVEKPVTNHVPKGGGKRGKIIGFSKSSRRRLMRSVAKVRRDLAPLFVTLTYPSKLDDDFRFFKRHLKMFMQRLKRAYPDCAGFWKLEPQRRGAPHFHLILWGVERDEWDYWHKVQFHQWVVDNWYAVCNSGDGFHWLFHMGLLGGNNEHCVKQLPPMAALKYVSKYMSKTVDFSVADWGRWWGCHNAELLPLGRLVSIWQDQKTIFDFIRYMRRYARIKSRAYTSLTCILNVDRWVSCLLW